MLVTLRRTDHMKVEFTPYELLSKVLFQVPKMSTSILLVSQSLSLSLSRLQRSGSALSSV